MATKSLWHDGKAVTDANENVCTLAAKNETQQRSAELKYINAQQKETKTYLTRGRIMF